MKNKYTLILALLLCGLLLAGCGDQRQGAEKTSDTVPEILSQAEYLLYQNVFYNDYGAQYEGREMVKTGVYSTLQDAFSDRTRYYVWGYLDNAKCCDWQWEFVPKDTKALPAEGSLVTVSGIFKASDDSLDGYWLENAAVQTEMAYTGRLTDLNMRAMSCTLERVQMFNILYVPDQFEGKQFTAYGRIAGVNTLEDPYYNGSWQIPFAADAQAPAIGTLVNLRGKVTDGALADCSLEIAP